MIYEIKSKQNQKIKDCLKLQQQSEKNKQKLFLIEGLHLLEMAIEANNLVAVFSLKPLDIVPLDIDQYIVTKDIMKKISLEKTPQGIVAICRMMETKEILSDKVLFLDQVRDPGNIGTLLRTALAFGYQDVIFAHDCCSPYHEKAIQSSQGAIFKLRLHEKPVSIATFKKQKYQILATEIKGSRKIETFHANKKHVLILGNEAHGVSNEVLSQADYRLRIDIKDIESLNVGVAGGITMYALTNSR